MARLSPELVPRTQRWSRNLKTAKYRERVNAEVKRRASAVCKRHISLENIVKLCQPADEDGGYIRPLAPSPGMRPRGASGRTDMSRLDGGKTK